MREPLHSVALRAARYLEEVKERRVGPSAEAIRGPRAVAGTAAWRGCGGAFVTGATVANFTALAAARHAVLDCVGWDVESEGLFGAPEIQVVVSEEAHPSVIKALGMLGMGRERVIRTPVDSQGRMRADRLPELRGPAIVCMQAGNVNTGSFDPAPEI